MRSARPRLRGHARPPDPRYPDPRYTELRHTYTDPRSLVLPPTPAATQPPTPLFPYDGAHDSDPEIRQKTGSTIPDPQWVAHDGRLYHGYREGTYWFPNDPQEQDRLDLQHKLWTVLMDDWLYWTPFPGRPSGDVLDIGTGTGIWALDFANRFPECYVTGTDLSMIQPRSIPRNCEFIQDDIEEEWIFGKPFDFIHLRLMSGCFNSHYNLMGKIFDNLKPNGWVEYQDYSWEPVPADGTDCLRGTMLERWSHMVQDGARALGRDFNVAPKYKDWLIQHGFVDVTEHRIFCPGNPWPLDETQRRSGKYMEVNACEALQGLSLQVLKHGLGMSVEDINQFVPMAQRDIRNRNIHFYWTCYVVYGRKPTSEEQRRTREGSQSRPQRQYMDVVMGVP